MDRVDDPDAQDPAGPTDPAQPAAGAPRGDRQAYLQEQIRKQKLGEPVDVAWVRAELERVRLEQGQRSTNLQRQMLWLAIVSGALLLILWIKGGGLEQRGGGLLLAVILIGIVTAVKLARRGP